MRMKRHPHARRAAPSCAAFPAYAQQYEARRNGDIVQLEDKKNQMIGVDHHVRRQLWPTR